MSASWHVGDMACRQEVHKARTVTGPGGVRLRAETVTGGVRLRVPVVAGGVKLLVFVTLDCNGV